MSEDKEHDLMIESVMGLLDRIDGQPPEHIVEEVKLLIATFNNVAAHQREAFLDGITAYLLGVEAVMKKWKKPNG